LNKKETYHVLFIDNEGLILYRFFRDKNIVELQDSRAIQEKESFHFSKSICIINTTDVISSKVAATSLESAFEEAFPAFKKNEVCIDFQTSEINSIAIIKKDKLNSILEKYQVASLNPLQIRLGTSACAIENKEENSHFSNDHIAELAVVSFITNQQNDKVLYGIESKLQEARTNKRIFEITKWSAVSFFLIVLLINFYFHEYYRKELGFIQQQQISIKELDQNIENTSNEIKTKEYLLKSNNITDINTLRFLNNQFASSGEIILEQLTYQPIRSSIENNEEIKLYNSQIKIIGKASTKKELNNYINGIQQLKSIEKVQIFSVEESGRSVLFELQIQLEDEVG
jgi:hypothetical protein